MTVSLTRLERLLAEATERPWECDPANPNNVGHPGDNPEGEWESLVLQAEDEEDAALICEAVNALPALIAAALQDEALLDDARGLIERLPCENGGGCQVMSSVRRMCPRCKWLMAEAFAAFSFEAEA